MNEKLVKIIMGSERDFEFCKKIGAVLEESFKISYEYRVASAHKTPNKVLEIMKKVQPDVVITFGPDGISGHPDHIAIGRAATVAFEKVIKQSIGMHKLYYVAIPKSVVVGVDQEELSDVTTIPDDDITTIIEMSGFFETKLRALGEYRS